MIVRINLIFVAFLLSGFDNLINYIFKSDLKDHKKTIPLRHLANGPSFRSQRLSESKAKIMQYIEGLDQNKI